MAQRILCPDSVLRYPLDALFDQICSLNDVSVIVSVARITFQNLNKISLAKVLISLQELQGGHLADFFQLAHLITVRHALDLSLLEDLKSLSIAREERCASDELKQNAACRPDIDAAVILVAAEDQFRSSIVPGDDVRGVQTFGVEDLCSAKVCNF